LEHDIQKTKQAEGKATASSRRKTNPDHAMPSPHPVLQLQQQAGNQAVQGALRPKAAGSDSAEKTSSPSKVDEVLGSPGQPLDAATRAFMEQRFEHDFSNVRVHTDADAALAARQINAQAYTAGSHVVFADNQFSPVTSEGQRLLAHELAHVVQQQRGGSSPPRQEGAALESAADAAAAAAVSGHGPVHVAGASAPGIARQPAPGLLRLSTGIEPRSLRGSLDAEALSEAALRQEIQLIEEWLNANPGDSWELNHLRLELDRLQLALEKKEHVDVPLEKPNLPDIKNSPRYIDNLFESVEFHELNGAFTFSWHEGGKEKTLTIPLHEVIQDDSASFFPLWELHKSKDEAVAQVYMWGLSSPKTQFYSFYERSDGIIMPTSFSIASTPEFHKLWPGLRRQFAASLADKRRGLQQIANSINPIPGTTVDEYGNLSLSGNPMDWIALIFHLKRLHEIRERGPITSRLHSGYDVPYTVTGPHGKLAGTSVYILKDAEGTVLYVGKGEALDRLREHIKDPKKTQWFGEISEIEVRATGLNNTQALALEENLIGELKPLYNVDQHPFQKEFGNTMQVGPNLPPVQKALRFFIEWGH
jgi:hypothetical protein